MISLRTIEGLNIDVIEKKFGKEPKDTLLSASKKYIQGGKMIESASGNLILTREGKLLADGIASDLFSI